MRASVPASGTLRTTAPMATTAALAAPMIVSPVAYPRKALTVPSGCCDRPRAREADVASSPTGDLCPALQQEQQHEDGEDRPDDEAAGGVEEGPEDPRGDVGHVERQAEDEDECAPSHRGTRQRSRRSVSGTRMAASTPAIASGMATSATSAKTPAMPSASQAPMPRVRNQVGVSKPVIPCCAAAAILRWTEAHRQRSSGELLAVRSSGALRLTHGCGRLPEAAWTPSAGRVDACARERRR